MQGQAAFNGGGIGYASNYGDYGKTGAFSGGGATDIRLVDGNWDNFDSLKSRIMVAAGGGGDSTSGLSKDCSSMSKAIGRYGGTLWGINNDAAINNVTRISAIYGGRQVEGGACDHMAYCGVGSFGKGGDSVANNHSNGGGGGGYYGGAADRSPYLEGSSGLYGGASGSCFISGYEGCNAISEDSTSNNIKHTGQSKHYSGYVFTNSKMIGGNESMPTHDGSSTMIGNGGNGYAKITLIS